MLLKKVKLYILIISLLIVSPLNISDRVFASPSPVVPWDMQYCIENMWCEYQAYALDDRTNDILIAYFTSNVPWSDQTNEKIYRLSRFNSNGEKIGEVNLNKLLESAEIGIDKLQLSDLISLNVLSDGSYLVLFDVIRVPWIIKISNENKLIYVKKVNTANKITILNVKNISNDRFLILGHNELDSTLIVTDQTGNVLIEKKLDLGYMDYFIDGLETTTGYVIVGNSGKYDMLRRGDSEVWIGKIDKDGNVLSQMRFTGRFGSLIKLRDSGYAFLYDKSVNNMQDIWLQYLSDTLMKKMR